MSVQFSALVFQDLSVWFTEPNSTGDISHPEILKRLSRIRGSDIENYDTYLRRFIRVECLHWTEGSFRFDESDTLPGWAEENMDELKERVFRTMLKVRAVYYKRREEQERLQVEIDRFYLLVRRRKDDDPEYILNKQAYENLLEKRRKINARALEEFAKIPGYIPFDDPEVLEIAEEHTVCEF